MTINKNKILLLFELYQLNDFNYTVPNRKNK